MVRTDFSTPIRVFHVKFAGEYTPNMLHGFLAERCTLAQFSCHGAHAQNSMESASITSS